MDESFVSQGSLTLILILFGFYLFDCCILLRPAQAVLRFRSARKAGKGIGKLPPLGLDFGLTTYPLRGRYLLILNPLTPFIAVFRTLPMAGAEPARLKPLRALFAAHLRLRGIAILIVLHGLNVFVVLPVQLLRGQMLALLIALGVAFLSALLVILLSNGLRRGLGISKPAFWSLAAQSLLCLPLTVNFPRKLALLASVDRPATALLARVRETERATAARDLLLGLRVIAEDGDGAPGIIDAAIQSLAKEYPDA